MKQLSLLAFVLVAACGSTAPRAETPRTVVVEADPSAAHVCGRPEHTPNAVELIAVLPEAERRVVAVDLAQLDGRGSWEALLLVNEGVVPKLYVFENVGGAWRLLDTETFELSMQPAEDEGVVELRAAALLGRCHHVVWVDLEVSNWAAHHEEAEGQFVKRSASLLVLVDEHLESRLTCDVAMRQETHDGERRIEGTTVMLSWSPDDPYPKPIRVRRRSGLATSMRLDEEPVVVEQDETFEVDGWASGHIECRRKPGGRSGAVLHALEQEASKTSWPTSASSMRCPSGAPTLRRLGNRAPKHPVALALGAQIVGRIRSYRHRHRGDVRPHFGELKERLPSRPLRMSDLRSGRDGHPSWNELRERRGPGRAIILDARAYEEVHALDAILYRRNGAVCQKHIWIEEEDEAGADLGWQYWVRHGRSRYARARLASTGSVRAARGRSRLLRAPSESALSLRQ